MGALAGADGIGGIGVIHPGELTGDQESFPAFELRTRYAQVFSKAFAGS